MNMLELLQFTEGPHKGRYAIQNKWTGNLLPNKHGEPKLFRTTLGATRYAHKVTRKLNKTMRSFNK